MASVVRLMNKSTRIIPIFTTTARKMSQNCERTFIMVKPDGVQRGLVGKIINRFEEKGFKLVGIKFMSPCEDLLCQHYENISKKPFFNDVIAYMSSGPVVPMVWEGWDVVKIGRSILGATNPAESPMGTIRGDLCIQAGRNVVHGSDSVEAAEKEIEMWFTEEELVDWKQNNHCWIFEEYV